MKISIIVAMESEYALLQGLVKDGRIAAHEVNLTRCGIGKVNAAVGAVEVIAAAKPDLVISEYGERELAIRLTDVDKGVAK